MNSQHKKLIALAAVVMLHAVVITLMLAQHGCKSDGQKSSPPDAATPAPAPVPAPAPTPAPVAVDNGFTTPTRPAPEVMATPIPLSQFEPTTPEPTLATPTPASSAPLVTWTVSKGDNLDSIARKNKITRAELIAANSPKVKVGTPLKIGQVLVIPASSSAAPATAQADAAAPATPDTSVYTVVAGDSLSKIASKNGTTAAALRSLNKLTTDTVRIGQKLNLPASGASTPASTMGAAPAVASSDGDYTVVSGDNLGKIASKTGTKTADLMSLNGLTDATARNLHPGQKLKLPAGGHAAAASTTSTPAATTTLSAPTFTAPAPGAPPPTPTPVSSVPDSTTSAPITHVQ